MLIIIIASILILNAIFWGLIPVSKHSPHQMMLTFLKLTINQMFTFICL